MLEQGNGPRVKIDSWMEDRILAFSPRFNGLDRLDQAVLSPAEIHQAEGFIKELSEHQNTGQALTVLLVGTKEHLVRAFISRATDRRVFSLKKKIQQLPTTFASYASDSTTGRPEDFAFMVGRRLGVFPRRFPDHYLYKSSHPEYTLGGMEVNRMSVVYNCIPIEMDSLPKNTYWHEFYIGDDFASYLQGVVMTVNKTFPVTTPNGLLARLFRR